MYKYSFILSISIFSIVTSFSQKPVDYSIKYSWLDKPETHRVHQAFSSNSAVFILDERKVEYKEENKNYVLYESYHKIIKVMNDKGVEQFNKVYIPISSPALITDIKARAVLENGKVINVDMSKMKDIEEDGTPYKIFAIDGLENGAEAEYAYTIKKKFSIFGTEIFQNGLYPSQQVNFSLISPANLKFSVKGYNGMPVSNDSVIDNKHITVSSFTDIPQLEDEKYSYKEKYLKRVDYKLSYNAADGEGVRVNTWKQFSKVVFSNITDRSDKDDKALNSFISLMKINIDEPANSKIANIEDYVKTNINIDKKLIGDGADVIEKIVKTKSANYEGAVKLMAGVFSKLNIPYELVFPSDRSAIPIDEELENWNRIEEYLFYFPETGKFISPTDVSYRYPYIPYNLAGTRGLFLKGTVIGNFKTAIGTFGEIKMEPFENHAHNMVVELKFNTTLDTVLVNSKQILKGYGGVLYRPVYNFLPQDKQDEVTKDIIKSVTGSTLYTNVKIENSKLTDCFNNDKPLIISADIKSPELIENAGSKILLKIGEIIGPQIQMYQEKTRQMPVELEYPHVLNRSVTIQIPDGYVIKNLQDLNFDVTSKENQVLKFGFISKYTLSGNTVKLEIDETYRYNDFPVSEFEIFKKVINASADFNKVVLVLEKKKV